MQPGLCFMFKFFHMAHKSWMQDFSLTHPFHTSSNLNKIKTAACVRNVLLPWFAFLLFVNPRKWTFPLSLCSTWECAHAVHVYCMNDRERAVKEAHRDRVEEWDTNRDPKIQEREKKYSGDIYLTDGWLHFGNSDMWTRWWTDSETGLLTVTCTLEVLVWIVRSWSNENFLVSESFFMNTHLVIRNY